MPWEPLESLWLWTCRYWEKHKYAPREEMSICNRNSESAHQIVTVPQRWLSNQLASPAEKEKSLRVAMCEVTWLICRRFRNQFEVGLEMERYLPLAAIWDGPRAVSPRPTRLAPVSVYYSPVAFISFTLVFCSSLLRFLFSLHVSLFHYIYFFDDHIPKVRK